LQELERLLPSDAILTSFKGSHDSRTIEATGTASNVDTIAVTLANLQNQQPDHPTLFKGGTISNVTQVIQTGPSGEVLGQRYGFAMSLTF
jgi:hypothetical protein